MGNWNIFKDLLTFFSKNFNHPWTQGDVRRALALFRTKIARLIIREYMVVITVSMLMLLVWLLYGNDPGPEDPVFFMTKFVRKFIQ